MGYTTHYTLDTSPVDYDEVTVAVIIELCGGFDPFSDGCKWYEHEEHMMAASARVPCIMILDGEGEDAGDIWRKVFADGKKIWEWRLDAAISPVPPAILNAANAVLVEKRVRIEKEAHAARVDALKRELAELESKKL